jgi:pimeloyl-ACP methyl ester carboxylesterase
MPRLLLFAAAALLLAGCVDVTVSEGDLLTARPDADTTDAVLPAEAVPPGYALATRTVAARDGSPLFVAHLRHPDARRTVLYLGPNGFRLSDQGASVAQAVADCQVDLVMVDYRGSGRSGGGPPTLDALRRDAVALYDAVAPEAVGGAPVVHGLSLGSGLAAHVARMRPTAGLVLEGGISTADALVEHLMAQDVAWYQRPFVRVRLDSTLTGAGALDDVRALDEPLLVLVGADDATTPPRFARTLYAAAALPDAQKTLHVLDGVGHENVKTHPAFADRYCPFVAVTVEGDATGAM